MVALETPTLVSTDVTLRPLALDDVAALAAAAAESREHYRLSIVPDGLRDGGVRNSAYYSIVAAEWPVVKARLASGLAARSV
jgi:hypothetical protein